MVECKLREWSGQIVDKIGLKNPATGVVDVQLGERWGDWGEWAAPLTNALTKGAEAVKQAITTGAETVKGVVNTVVDAAGNAVQAVKNKIEETFEAVLKPVTTPKL